MNIELLTDVLNQTEVSALKNRRKRPTVPVSTYAQLRARREYYARNKVALVLRQKMYRADVVLTTAEARLMAGAP